MASRTLHSGQVNFIDFTDSRKLEVHIASNLPTVQILDQNTNTYSPNWNLTPLILTPSIFLSSKEITDNSQVSVTWYKKINSETTETKISTNKTLTISTNAMSDTSSIITYICVATYQGLTSRTQMSFSLSVSGKDGADGTSVSILGSYGSLAGLQAAHPTGNVGDAYIVKGNLYVWSEDNSEWTNVGSIQGPKGDDAKSIILNGSSQVFKVSKTNVISPATISVVAHEINITVTNWAYSTDGGQTFSSTAPSCIIKNGDTITVTGANMTSNTITIKASNGDYNDVYTIYKVFDGTDGEKGDIGVAAPIAFLTNENIVFNADSQGRIAENTITSKIVAYNGNTKVLPEIESIAGIPEDYVQASSYSEDTTYYVYLDNNPSEAVEASPQPTAENFQDGEYYVKSMSIITKSYDDTKEIDLSIYIADGATLGSLNSISGEIFIYIISPIVTTLRLGWNKINTGTSGTKGSDAVTFQIYSENGYILSKEVPDITLRTFAYNGSTPIETGATYQWYKYVNNQWEQIADAIDDNFSLSHYDVGFNCSYMCKMIFNDAEYVSVVTIDDKNDTNTVFTSKPSSYMVGDVWVVGNDYQPTRYALTTTYSATETYYSDNNGTIASPQPTSASDLENGGYYIYAGKIAVGTVLKSEHANNEYMDGDWVNATRYDEQLKDLKDDIDNYNQYFSFNKQQGLVISAKDDNGTPSKFSASLSNTQLSLNYDNEAVASISNSKMHISEAEIELPLTVTGKYSEGMMLQAPTINLGDFSLVVESNGSLSIISNL